MDDDYHNILSEEFPSPIRHHDTLPDLTLEAHQHEQHHANALAHNIQSIPGIHESSSLHPSPHPSQGSLEPHDREADDEALDAELARHDREGLEASPHHGPADAEDRRRVGVKHLQLTAVEKRERQKAQNRKAAERSRAKKREELEALEMGVTQMGEENAKLRARLAELLAARSSVAPPEIAPTPPPASSKTVESGIDYAYLNKIQSEMLTAKAKLLERELQLNNLRQDKPVKADSSVDNLRRGLLKQYTKQTYLQAEATSLETTIGQIRTERDELAKQADMLHRDVEHRKTYQIVEVPQEPAQEDVMGVDVGVGEMGQHEEIAHDHDHEEAIGDKSMMDIGGWVDAAWQASGHPVSVGIDKE